MNYLPLSNEENELGPKEDAQREIEPEPDNVFVEETHVGKGVFSLRDYPATAIIGEITGSIIDGSASSSEYTFDYEGGMQLEPDAPFKYVNHSCDPNCEFEILDVPGLNGEPDSRRLYLIATRIIRSGEEFTISYNWPASCAIECHCNSPNCVGWIVCETEIDQIVHLYDDDFEQANEVPDRLPEEADHTPDEFEPTPNLEQPETEPISEPAYEMIRESFSPIE